jgi:hypothetical protein
LWSNLSAPRGPPACCVAAALGLMATATPAEDSRSHDRIQARMRAFAEMAKAINAGVAYVNMQSTKSPAAAYCLIASIWINSRMLSGIPGRP